jgi:copper chaperone
MIELVVPALSCGHCVRTVTEAVQRIDPLARVDVDLESRRVRIESSAPPDRLEAALAAEGYPPQPMR